MDTFKVGHNKEARWGYSAHNVHIKHRGEAAMLSNNTGRVTLNTAHLHAEDWFWDSIWVGSEPLMVKTAQNSAPKWRQVGPDSI